MAGIWTGDFWYLLVDGRSLLLQNRIDQKSKEIFLPEAGNLGCHQTPEELQHRVQSNSLKKKSEGAREESSKVLVPARDLWLELCLETDLLDKYFLFGTAVLEQTRKWP